MEMKRARHKREREKDQERGKRNEKVIKREIKRFSYLSQYSWSAPSLPLSNTNE